MKAKMFTSWSFTRYSDYKQCPLKAKLRHLDKIQEPASEALQRGRDVHEAAEAYLKGKLEKLPAELARFAAEFDRLLDYRQATGEVLVEEDWAYTRGWKQARWDDWENCWVRIKLDCAEREGHTLHITDWKTGKYRPDQNAAYMEQLELYALAAFLRLPDVEIVIPRLVYLDLGKVYPEVRLVYAKSEVPRLKREWAARVKPMLRDRIFAPKPNPLCGWCHYRKANGGPCEF